MPNPSTVTDPAADAQDAQRLDALTRPGEASDYHFGWAHGARASYFEDETAMAVHDAALRSALADMQFPAAVGGSVATLLLDELAKVQALPDDGASRQLWELEQDQTLARIVGPQNVEAAKTAAAELASQIKDRDYAAELEALGAFKSATWASQAWLQSQRIAARSGRP